MFLTYNRIFLGLVASLLLLTAACNDEQDTPIEPDRYPGSARGNFEAYWNGINRNYQFFSIHNLDWDQAYENKVDSINEELTGNEFFNILVRMSGGIKDYHFTLIAGNRAWGPSFDDPRFDTKSSLPTFYFTEIVPAVYLDTDFKADEEWEVSFGNLSFAPVQYVRVGSF